jgi:hypothetical protein
VEDGMWQIRQFNGPNCDPSYPFTSTAFVLGKCILSNLAARGDSRGEAISRDGNIIHLPGLFDDNNGLLFSSEAKDRTREDLNENGAMVYSYLYLANVNDSYVSPQPQSPPNPEYNVPEQFNYECYSADNCTFEGSPSNIWTTSFHEINCTDAYRSTATHNLTYGACYRNPSQNNGVSYMKSLCAGEHATMFQFFYGNGCQDLFQTKIQSLRCGPTSLQNLHCIAPSEPMTVPSSHAHSNANFQSSSLLFCLLLALFGFFSI